MALRKNVAGYTKVPLLRSNGRGGSEVAHYWMRDHSSRVPLPSSDSLRDMVEELEREDEDDIIVQSIVRTLSDDPVDWHDPQEGFDGHTLAQKYGERFRDAKIVEVTTGGGGLCCLAAHGEKSLFGALWKMYSAPEFNGDDGTAWTVEGATSIMWNFSNQSALHRSGIVPLDVTKTTRSMVLPSIVVNGKTPLEGGVPVLADGDLRTRTVFTPDELREALGSWEAGVVTPTLSTVVHEYAEYQPRLHRVAFFDDAQHWEDAIAQIKERGVWGDENEVFDLYDTKYRASAADQRRSPSGQRYFLHFEIFGGEAVNVKSLLCASGVSSSDSVDATVLLAPGPERFAVVGTQKDVGAGRATVYLIPEKLGASTPADDNNG